MILLSDEKFGTILKRYSSSVGLYFFASLIPMVLNLITNPLIAINMSPEDYAIVGFYSSFTTLLSPFIVFYMFHYYTKAYFECNEEQRIRLRSTIIKSLVWFSGLLSILSFSGVFCYLKYCNGGSDLPIFPYLILTIMAIPFSGLFTFRQTDLKMRRESKTFFGFTVSNGLMLTASNLFFVACLKWGAVGKLMAPLVINICFFSYSIFLYRKDLKIDFDWILFRKILKFCFPLTIAAMLGFFANGYDKVFLERLGNHTELGYYVVGVQIASYINVFQNALGSTFQPDLFQAIAEKNHIKLTKIITMLVGSISIIAIAFILCCPYIIKLLTAGRYMMSVEYARISAISVVTSMLYYTMSQITIAKGYTLIPLINKIITSILCIVMFSVMITSFKYKGAAWGLSLSFIISLVGNIILILIFEKLQSGKSQNFQHK